MLEWALFAQKYNLELLEEHTVQGIVLRFREVKTLAEFDQLGQPILQRISWALDKEW